MVISIHDVSVLPFSITDDYIHDAKEGKKIMESVKDRPLRIFGDGGNDSKGHIQHIFFEHSDPAKEDCSLSDQGTTGDGQGLQADSKKLEK